MFPEAFKNELEVWRWYKGYNSIFFLTKIENKLGYAYGIDEGIWKDECSFRMSLTEKDVEATPQEVEAALISEAKKRGYNNKNYSCLLLPESTHKVKNNYNFNIITNQLFQGKSAQDKNNVVFDSGIWAEIIQPEKMTLEQIEKELGRKIELI